MRFGGNVFFNGTFVPVDLRRVGLMRVDVRDWAVVIVVVARPARSFRL